MELTCKRNEPLRDHAMLPPVDRFSKWDVPYLIEESGQVLNQWITCVQQRGKGELLHIIIIGEGDCFRNRFWRMLD
mgnify:CR=1 FL=1